MVLAMYYVMNKTQKLSNLQCSTKIDKGHKSRTLVLAITGLITDLFRHDKEPVDGLSQSKIKEIVHHQLHLTLGHLAACSFSLLRGGYMLHG